MKKLQCNTLQSKEWRHFRAVFTGNITQNIIELNHSFELLDINLENHFLQNINRVGQNGSLNGNTTRNILVKT